MNNKIKKKKKLLTLIKENRKQDPKETIQYIGIFLLAVVGALFLADIVKYLVHNYEYETVLSFLILNIIGALVSVGWFIKFINKHTYMPLTHDEIVKNNLNTPEEYLLYLRKHFMFQEPEQFIYKDIKQVALDEYDIDSEEYDKLWGRCWITYRAMAKFLFKKLLKLTVFASLLIIICYLKVIPKLFVLILIFAITDYIMIIWGMVSYISHWFNKHQIIGNEYLVFDDNDIVIEIKLGKE